MAGRSSVERNRRAWTEWSEEFAESAPKRWAEDEITWGVWHVPERP
jgi:hypothetical protein